MDEHHVRYHVRYQHRYQLTDIMNEHIILVDNCLFLSNSNMIDDETYYNDLSKLYSNGTYIVVVFPSVCLRGLAAVAYRLNPESDDDIVSHLNDIHESHGFTSTEMIMRVYVNNGVPPMTSEGEVDYRLIRMKYIHEL